MRKAGLKNRSRRKGSSSKDDVPLPTESTLVPSVNDRRKPTNEEAALTAKNYRLAKELSDLRVRHRDETKNVTRLTLENMNLASRCREAISHVAVLKKELAMHQRRAAEALALQRQQTQRVASGVSDPAPVVNMSDVMGKQQAAEISLEMDRMDRILASHPTTSPLVNVDKRHDLKGDIPSIPVVASEQETPSSDGEKDNFVDVAVSKSPSRVGVCDSKSSENPLLGSKSPGFDVLRSERLSREPPDDRAAEESQCFSPISRRYTIEDVPADEMISDKTQTGGNPTSIFPHSASPKVTVRGSYNEEFPADLDHLSRRKASQAPVVKRSIGNFAEQEDDMSEDTKGSSSIDAFEASFATTFPPSFSTATREEASPQPASSEIYNPFFHSPSKQSVNGGRAESLKRDSRLGAKEDSWQSATEDVSAVNQENSAIQLPAAEQAQKNNSEGNDLDTGFLPASGEQSARKLGERGDGEPLQVTEAESTAQEPEPLSMSNRLENNSRHLFPESPMSTFEMLNTSSGGSEDPNTDTKSKDSEPFTTPPQLPGEDAPERPLSEQPRRPEKPGAAAARARYERALQPRVFGGSSRAVGRLKDRKGDSPELKTAAVASVKSVADSTHSPSLVLKRLQQRRVKDRPLSMHSTPSGRSSSPNLAVVSGGSNIALNERTKRTGAGRPLVSTEKDMFSPSDEEDVPPRKIRNSASFANKALSTSTRDTRQQTGESSLSDVIPVRNESGYPVRSRSSAGASSKSLSPESMTAEIRALDAIASGSYVPVETGKSEMKLRVGVKPGTPTDDSSPLTQGTKNRRRVKQPVSYAEPSLNSKLRRGDVYFPKGDKGIRAGENPPVVSPTSSPPDEVSESATLSRQKSRPAVGSEEVLKDLGGSAAVRL